jgi:hypothetical protein
VDVAVIAVGETMGESLSMIVSKLRDDTLGFMGGLGALGSIGDGDGGGENVTGEGNERNMFPPVSKILDRRRFRSRLKSKPDRSKIGR